LNDAAQSKPIFPSFAERKQRRKATYKTINSSTGNTQQNNDMKKAPNCLETGPSKRPGEESTVSATPLAASSNDIPSPTAADVDHSEPRRRSMSDEAANKNAVRSKNAVNRQESQSMMKRRTIENSGNKKDNWCPIKRIVSRRRQNVTGAFLYKVAWQTEPETYSYLPAKDITPAAIRSFYSRLKRHGRVHTSK